LDAEGERRAARGARRVARVDDPARRHRVELEGSVRVGGHRRQAEGEDDEEGSGEKMPVRKLELSIHRSISSDSSVSLVILLEIPIDVDEELERPAAGDEGIGAQG